MSPDRPTPVVYDSIVGLLVRSWWLVVGNVVLAFVAVGIAKSSGGQWLGVLDLPYWLIAGSLVAARHLDVAHLHGTTSDGDPADMGHFRRHAAWVAVASVGIWLAAHGTASFLAG